MDSIACVSVPIEYVRKGYWFRGASASRFAAWTTRTRVRWVSYEVKVLVGQVFYYYRLRVDRYIVDHLLST